MSVVLSYHELSGDDSPLCIPPGLFSEHLAALVSAGATVLTAAELVHALERRAVPERAVALTFDDGFATAVREARPRLAHVGMRATFYCVAGHLGGRSDWPSRLPGAPVRPLASPRELAALAAEGHEIGSHGWSHAPLDGTADLERELVGSKRALEAAAGVAVTTFAYPYGAPPSREARALVERTYAGAFGAAPHRVCGGADRTLLPRIDAHYLRDPRLLGRVVDGSLGAYLGLRRVGSRTRRAFRKDYVTAAEAAREASSVDHGR